MNKRLLLSAALSMFFASLFGCSSGGSTSSSSPVSVTALVYPTISAVSPAKIAAGAASTTLTVTGTNFLSTSSVQLNGVVEPTSFVSATQLTATVPAAQLASGNLLPVIVSNGTTSSAAGSMVNLEIDNPSPIISTFLPSTLTTGSTPGTVAVTGTGFVPTTTVQINGSARSTAFVSATQINVILTVADLASTGSLSLVVVNAAPGGGTSAAASIAVNNPLPTLTSVTPATIISGTTTPTTITVTGTNFLPSSSVLVGTAAHAATYVGPTQLTFALTAADQAAIARLAVTVVNPAPGGGTSAVGYVTVAAPHSRRFLRPSAPSPSSSARPAPASW